MASRGSSRTMDRSALETSHIPVPAVQLSALEAMREQSLGGVETEVYRSKQFPFRIQSLLRMRKKKASSVTALSPVHEVISLPVSPSQRLSVLASPARSPQLLRRRGGGFLVQKKPNARPLQKGVAGHLPKLFRVYLN